MDKSCLNIFLISSCSLATSCSLLKNCLLEEAKELAVIYSAANSKPMMFRKHRRNNSRHFSNVVMQENLRFDENSLMGCIVSRHYVTGVLALDQTYRLPAKLFA